MAALLLTHSAVYRQNARFFSLFSSIKRFGSLLLGCNLAAFLFPALFAEFKSFLAARSRAAWAKDKGAGRG